MRKGVVSIGRSTVSKKGQLCGCGKLRLSPSTTRSQTTNWNGCGCRPCTKAEISVVAVGFHNATEIARDEKCPMYQSTNHWPHARSSSPIQLKYHAVAIAPQHYGIRTNEIQGVQSINAGYQREVLVTKLRWRSWRLQDEKDIWCGRVRT